MTSSPSLTTAPLPLSGQSGIGWSIRRPSPGRPGDGRHDQLGNFQTALLGRITPASTSVRRYLLSKDLPNALKRLDDGELASLLAAALDEAKRRDKLPSSLAASVDPTPRSRKRNEPSKA